MRESRLYQILRVDTAPNQVAILYEKGLLKHDIKYLTPNQVGGRNSAATDPGQVSGVHLMSDGETYSMSMPDRGRLGNAKSHAPDHGVGTSSIQGLFLSVVEIHAEPPTPMLATCISTMACYFTCATSLVIIPNRFLNFRDDVTRGGS